MGGLLNVMLRRSISFAKWSGWEKRLVRSVEHGIDLGLEEEANRTALA
jgi:hypothetical protein